MKKLLAMMLILLPMMAVAQTFSKEKTLWTGIKESHLYEMLKVIEKDGKVTVAFAVADDECFPYGDLEVVSYGAAQKVQKFIKKILDLNEKMENDMSYHEEKNKFYAQKSVIFDEEILYVSTDMQSFHGFRPKMLKLTLECLESYIADPKNPKTDKRYFN